MDTKEPGVQSKDFPLSGSKVTCGKENRHGSERDIVMSSLFFSFPLNFIKGSEHQYGKLR